jgi:alpha-D-ribose 1-methylphosphonate 5-triphosphate diphosphatase
MNEMVFRNGRIVLPDRVVEGAVVVRDGLILEVGEGRRGGSRSGIELDGDWLIPGLVELHTDHLEGHYSPRPRVRWNPIAAVQAHDAQIASSGITTVFDAIRVGMDEDTKLVASDMRTLGAAISESQAGDRLRADHYIHLRCEVSATDAIESFMHFAGEPLARLASLMDHTPGQRQFTSLEAFRIYYLGKSGMSETELQAFIERRLAQSEIYSAKQRQAIAEMCRERGIVLASHDDATTEHVAEAADIGVSLAEFPTTMEAAQASRQAGMKILMGAPNIVRGGSHSGNIAARDLVAEGLLDVLSSDYFPFSLLHAAFKLAQEADGITLPQAVAMVSLNPATTAGLDDRGAILPGRRADLVQVRKGGDVPVVRTVWRQGRRVV